MPEKIQSCIEIIEYKPPKNGRQHENIMQPLLVM